MQPFSSRLLFLCIIALVCIHCPIAFAQGYLNETGTPTFTTQWPDQLGFMNISNGNIHIEIPFAQHAQRGGLHLNERLVYDSRIWQITPASTNYQWEPTNVANSMGGWRLVTGNEGGTNSYLTYTVSGTCGPKRSDPCVETYVFFWTDPGGTQHEFIGPTVDRSLQPCSTGCPTAFSSAIDASGYQLEFTNRTSTATVSAVFDPNGTQIYPFVQDPNGNAWSKDASGNLVDTLGRTPLKTTVNGNQIYYDVLTFGGGTSRYTVTTETINVNTAFQEPAVNELSASFTAIASIALPDGSFFRFNYDSGTASGNYGELTSVTLPTGGTITYGYGNYFDSYQNVNRWPTSRTDSAGTTNFTPAVVTQCSSGGTGCVEKMTVTKPDQNDVVYSLTLNNGSWNTQIDEWKGSSVSGHGGSLARTTLPTYDYSHACGNPKICTGADVITKTNETVTLWDAPGGAVATQTQYATNLSAGKLSSVKQWDYYPVSSGPPANPLRQTAYSYSYVVNGAGLLSQATVSDGSGIQLSQTTTGYDETTGTGHKALTPTSGLSNHNAVTGNRGNLTTTQQWINTTGGTFNTTAAYSDAGALVTSADPNGTTTYGYDSTDTYTTSIMPPTPSSGVALPYSATYDPSTGLLMTTTDPNGTKTVYNSYDAFGRVTEVDTLDSGANTVGKTTTSYTSTQASIYDYQNASLHSDTEILYDGYGRVSRSALNNGQSGNDWYQQDTCYDSSGRPMFQSYTYQGTGFAQAIVCSNAGDTYSYDGLGRVLKITHADASAVTSAYTGRATKVTDENGASRIIQSDALARTTAVCEISGSTLQGAAPGACGLDIAATGFLTTYAYTTDTSKANALKTTVTQGAQARTFEADSLGRTTMVTEPESSTTTYSYAYSTGSGLGLTVARKKPTANQANPANLTTTTTQYDSLGRVVSVVYSDGTPTKTFAYDAASNWSEASQQTNLKGRLSWHYRTTGAGGAGTIYGYDATGRVTQQYSCLPSGCGTAAYDRGVGYTYNMAGMLTSEGDGAGDTYTYTRSIAGEITGMTDSFSDATDPANIIVPGSVQNGPFGPITYNFGNGLTAVNTYDSLGRNSGGFVCAGSSQPSCAGGTRQVYGYANQRLGTRITQSCDTIVNVCNSFGYDEFNRLTARTVTQGTVQNFTYTYDRYGNRWAQNAPQGGPGLSISFNQANNIINATGFSNDAVGNVAGDTFHAYSFDADGNLISVDNGQTASYYYDSLNQRVRIAPTRGTYEFVWDIFGRRVSNWAASNHGFVESNAYTDSGPIAFRSGGNTTFEHQNWLGTERVRTSYNGATLLSIDSLPWADGHTPSGDNGDQHDFALMDRDLEDSTEHAQYRQFSTNLGRWLSPDQYMGSYDFNNPQSFNRYAYALNSDFPRFPRFFFCPPMTFHSFRAVFLGSQEPGIDSKGWPMAFS